MRAPDDVGDDDAVRAQTGGQVEVGDEHVERRLGRRGNRALGVLECTDDGHRLVGQRGREHHQQQGFVLE